jgi:hypothetical protein
MLDRVLNQLEGTKGDRTGGTKSPTPAEDVTMADNPATGDSPEATGEPPWSKAGQGDEKWPFPAAGRR